MILLPTWLVPETNQNSQSDNVTSGKAPEI